jgi:signal transduction histidine kinase
MLPFLPNLQLKRVESETVRFVHKPRRMLPTADARTFDDRDRIYVILRMIALMCGVAYAFLSVSTGPLRSSVLFAHGSFLVYSTLAYAVGWPLARLSDKTIFYLAMAGLDLIFCIALIALTGGAASPFYRALYVWVAMFAFYFGRTGGLRSAVLALTVYSGFHLVDDFRGDPWVLLVQGGGMLMHGPLIGMLTDRERRRAHELREARDRLAEINTRLVDEQSQRIQVEKLSSIGLLASGVAHEINNPLSGVMGCVKSLRDGTVPEDRRGEYFATVTEGLERIRQTVRGLLDYARQRPLAPSEVDVHEVMDASVRLVQPALHKKRVTTDLRLSPGSVHVYADRAQLMQVLVNLLLNAAEASSANQTITLDARPDPTAGGVRLTVRDEGCGIPEHIKDRICDPFFTTKPEGQGTGLGLSVSLGIVRNHGGELTFESEEGAGTTAIVRLPGAKNGRPSLGG